MDNYQLQTYLGFSPDSLLPKTIRHIGDDAFTGCTNLSKIYGLEPVKSIGKEAFKNTGLENLTLPAGLVQIGEECFSYCSKLEAARILLNKPIKFDRTFARCSNLNKVESCVWYKSFLDAITHVRIDGKTFEEIYNDPDSEIVDLN